VVEACGKASTVQQLSTIEIYIQHRERYQNNQNIYYHKLRTWNISLTTYGITLFCIIKNNKPYLISLFTYSKHMNYTQNSFIFDESVLKNE